MDGIERIAAERQRQIDEEGYTPEHDQEHGNGALAYAAACYAAPEQIFRVVQQRVGRDGEVYEMIWHEPWPRGWKRREFPHGSSRETRIRDLEKAGALIAAELDRLLAS